ncbi:hypothetical protein RFI_38363, partial [Reticulomyxa filosa]
MKPLSVYQSKINKKIRTLNALRNTIREREGNISKLEIQVKDYTQKLNEANKTNAQLSSEMNGLRERICVLAVGIGIESEFPSMNKIATTYEEISDNYRVNLTSEIMTQLKNNETIKETYAMSFLARFSHCVSFSVLLLSYEF